MYFKKIILPLILLGILVFSWILLSSTFTLDNLRQQREALVNFALLRPYYSAFLFFVLYCIATALSLPVASLLGLAAGMIFGLIKGSLLVSFASSLGATIAFLLARYYGRDAFRRRYAEKFTIVNEAFKREGLFYLFALRLTPSFPFFLVNILMGLTEMSVAGFYLVSQLGMLPGTLVYVNAGTELQGLESIKDLFSPKLLLAFFLLGILPLFSRWVMRSVRLLKQSSVIGSTATQPGRNTSSRERPE